MATPADAEAHREEVSAWTTLAVAQLVDVFAEAATLDPAEAAAMIRDAVEAIVEEFGQAAATGAVDFYSFLRDRAAPTTRFTPTSTWSPDLADIQRKMSYHLSTLFPQDRTLDPDFDTALSRTAGEIQKRVADAARETMEENARRDPAVKAFRRHAEPDACAFCALLATRDDYTSEMTAIFRRNGKKYHDWCQCEALPVFEDDEEIDPRVAAWKDSFDRSGTTTDLKAALAFMRDDLGLRH